MPQLDLDLQFLELPDQQRDMLEEVTVGQEQLPDPGLGFDPCRGLGRQLILQQLHLPGKTGQEGNHKKHEERCLVGGRGGERDILSHL